MYPQMMVPLLNARAAFLTLEMHRGIINQCCGHFVGLGRQFAEEAIVALPEAWRIS